jgi:glycine cleavage system regulatory protein
MQRSLVMTMIGPDRPGLVEAVADIVTKHSGNWLDSRMSRLGGHFAGILRVGFPGEHEEKIIGALRALESRGLSVVIHLDHPSEQPVDHRFSEIEIVGHDRPGIVREISHVLASHGVNVEELDTDRGSAAMSGEAIFKARAALRIPKTCDVGKLRRDLERIAADLIVDISLKEKL